MAGDTREFVGGAGRPATRQMNALSNFRRWRRITKEMEVRRVLWTKVHLRWIRRGVLDVWDRADV